MFYITYKFKYLVTVLLYALQPVVTERNAKRIFRDLEINSIYKYSYSYNFLFSVIYNNKLNECLYETL